MIGLVLAAGGSTRMGRPKSLLSWEGRPWLCHHVQALRPHVDRVRVVLGARAEQIAAVLPEGVEVVLNVEWQQTDMAASLALGLFGLPAKARVLVTPVDVPPAPARVLAALIAQPGAIVPTVDGCDAHPVVILAGPSRAALTHHTLREVLTSATRIELGWREGLCNINTPEDWERWRERNA
ncbi:MAG: NTP transferase domain-containing protein [Oligoflexia bacterium]|nr:NTP transferase domain-containing protein [Oligoflexia bacterium]